MSTLQHANKELRDGNYDSAISLYEKHLEKNPSLSSIILPNLNFAKMRKQKALQILVSDSPHKIRDTVNNPLLSKIVQTLNEEELTMPVSEASKILEQWIYPTSDDSTIVYTAIFGNYDALKDPTYKVGHFHYVCFTDQENLRSNFFEIRKLTPIFKNKTKNARLIKLLPHLFLPNATRSLWIDGSTQIRGRSIEELFSAALEEHDIAVHPHFQRKCTYAEGRECIAQKKDDKAKIEAQLDYIKNAGFPEDVGLVETAQLLRRHTVAVSQFNETWWDNLNKQSVRDQLSFNFTAWKLNLNYKSLKGAQWLDQYFKNFLHTDKASPSVKGNPSVNIVMLVRNALELTSIATTSILEKTKYSNYFLTIVDNDSDADTKAYLASLSKKHDKVKILTNETNESFSKANNQAVSQSESDYVLFINNDIEIIQEDWLSRLLVEALSSETIGAVGPVLLYPDYTIQSASIKLNRPDDIGMFAVPANELKEYRHSGFVESLTGGCLLVRRTVHDSVGGFDDRFFYGQEDIDYCLKIREAGFKLKFVAHTEVIHHESATRKFGFQTIQNRKLIRSKWSSRITAVPKVGQEKKPVTEEFKKLIFNKKITYKSYGDLQNDIKSHLHTLPKNLGLIVGIPRSGMIPAYSIGLQLNLPVLSIDELVNGVESFKGDRKRKGELGDVLNVLIVDDSINNGNAYSRFKNILPPKFGDKICNYHFVAIYGSENWINDDVKTLVRVNLPRLFEWNYLNHGISQFSCYDLDGVLCHDPSDEENDDGRIYTEFVLNAPPLFIPTFQIRAIVTSRLEKYRAQTVEWLQKNNVKYKELYMLDLPDKATRLRLKAHAPFKTEVYKSLSDTVLFFESNKGQAKQIADATKKAVICTDDNSFLPG